MSLLSPAYPFRFTNKLSMEAVYLFQLAGLKLQLLELFFQLADLFFLLADFASPLPDFMPYIVPIMLHHFIIYARGHTRKPCRYIRGYSPHGNTYMCMAGTITPSIQKLPQPIVFVLKSAISRHGRVFKLLIWLNEIVRQPMTKKP